VSVAERAQFVGERGGGARFSVVGPGSLYIEPNAARGDAAALALTLADGWLKILAKPPGIRVRTAAAELASTEGALVLHVQGATLDAFVESGAAQVAALGAGAEPPRPGREGEFWSNAGTGRLTPAGRAPKAFVDAMPRPYFDPLPALAGKFKTKPALVADGDVSYAEAAPWLDGRDRAVFEKRFTPRLRDPAFRRAVEPQVARYAAWDRMLHPEKYEPKPAAAK